MHGVRRTDVCSANHPYPAHVGRRKCLCVPLLEQRNPVRIIPVTIRVAPARTGRRQLYEQERQRRLIELLPPVCDKVLETLAVPCKSCVELLQHTANHRWHGTVNHHCKPATLPHHPLTRF